MKLKYLRYGCFFVVLALFCVTMALVRTQSKVAIRQDFYRDWQKNYVVTQGDQAYVKTTNDTDKDVVLSEGQGYGMVITEQAAEKGDASQADFEKLYNYYLNHRIENTQLMSWRQELSGEAVTDDSHSATDGDLYIAYALLEAAEQWPDRSQEYQDQAKAILTDILQYNYNQETGVLTVGNWADSNSQYYYLMRTSDTLPKQFQDFYEFTQDQRWLDIKDKMLSQLEQISSESTTGLLPDFIWVEPSGTRVAEANTIESEFDGAYSYNACRLPYNLAQSDDEQSQKLLDKMLNFFMSQDAIYSVYDLSGKALSDHQSSSFLAPISYAAQENGDYLKLVQQNKFIFMNALPTDNYYDATLMTMVAQEMF